MWLSAWSDERNVRRKREVPGSLLPDKVEGVFGKPHVLATTGHGVARHRCVKCAGPGMQHGSYVLLVVEDPYRRSSFPSARRICLGRRSQRGRRHVVDAPQSHTRVAIVVELRLYYLQK